MRKVESGIIEVCFDDKTTPVKTAVDTTKQWGMVGLGSFAVLPTSERQGDTVQKIEKEKASATGAGTQKNYVITEWARDPSVAKGVAISLDDGGSAYVTSAFRRKQSGLDIRRLQNWVETDLPFTSVEDRRKFYREHLPLLDGMEDRDGDGVPDPPHLVAGGLQVHIGRGGHNLSGVALGSDGRVYLSLADKGHSLTTAEGVTYHEPNSGAIFRCELDGSRFERFSLGERNAQEVEFDACGNLLSMGNDGDYPGEMERVLNAALRSGTSEDLDLLVDFVAGKKRSS